MIRLAACALALLMLAGVVIYQAVASRQTASSYDTMGSVVYRVDEDRAQGYEVSYRL